MSPVGEDQLPVVIVLGAGEDTPPPAIGLVAQVARLRFAAGLEELARLLEEADVLFVWDFRSTELREVWHLAKRLRWVHVAGAGVDALLFPELARSGVTVTNSRGVFDRPIAEYVLGLVLLFAKDLRGTLELQRSRRWAHRETETLPGKRMLIVGAGPIGREIARIGRCVGLEVDAVARSAREWDPDFGRVFSSEDLNAALHSADYVVVAAPLTEATRGMFGAEQFANMKRDARLINVGRGPIVDEQALVGALRDGEIAGAALDVFCEEPLPKDNPLWGIPQVVVSPHMSGDFVGWLDALGTLFAENFCRWRRGEELLNVVDKGRGYVPSEQ
jgi:phosphoglycerate dehydrogenase-like enzyme